MDRDSRSEINNSITKRACGQHNKTEVTSLRQSTQVSSQHRFLVSVPRPVIHAHKSKIITGNLGAKLRSHLQSPKTTNIHVSSAWKIKVIIGIIGPGVICYISYFVPLYSVASYIFKEVCFSGMLTKARLAAIFNPTDYSR